MARRLLSFLLALLLACSSAGAAARVLMPAGGDEQASAHLVTIGHHDPNAGSDPAGDAQQLLAQNCECDDGATDPALLTPVWPGLDEPLPRTAPIGWPDTALPTPFLEGPMRPPRR